MALGAAVILAALAAEDDDLRSTGLADDRGAHGCALNPRGPDCDLVAVAQHDDVVENHLGAFVSGDPLD